MGFSIFPLVKLGREIVINPAGRAFGTMLDLTLAELAEIDSVVLRRPGEPARESISSDRAAGGKNFSDTTSDALWEDDWEAITALYYYAFKFSPFGQISRLPVL